jgi:hypothetical protein
VKPVAVLETLDDFVLIRHRMWLEKTYMATFDLEESDNIKRLRGYRFTNIWRELDRNTRHLINHIHTGDLEKDILNTVRFRLFNRIDTSNFLLEEFGTFDEAFSDAERLHDVLAKRSRKGASNFTASYAMTFGLIKTCYALELTEYGYEVITASANKIKAGDNKGAWRQLRKLTGVGAFMADMILMDVTWMGGKYYDKDTAFYPDYKRGSLEGYNYCQETDQGDTDELLAKCQNRLKDYADTLPLIGGQPIHFGHRELEHSLCEYNKYIRLCKSDGVQWVDLHLQIYRPYPVENALPKTWKAPNTIDRS